VRFWFQPNDTSQPTDPNLFPPDITPPPTPPAGGGSNAGAGVGGSGGGKWLRKYVDELEYLVEIEKRLKKGKTLKEAIAELKKDPEIAKEVSRIEKKALARKPEAIRWIAEQLRSREPRDIIAPSPDYLDEAIEFMEADEEIVMVAVAIAALRKRSS
jgi:hypothetical protein